MSRSPELDGLIGDIERALGPRWPAGREEVALVAAEAVVGRVRAAREERDDVSAHAERLAEAVEGHLFGDLEQVELLMAWLAYQSVLADETLD